MSRKVDLKTNKSPVNWLVSLPQSMLAAVNQGTFTPPDGVWCGADPAGVPLGSGGGTVHLLQSAAQAGGVDLPGWLSSRCSLVLHGGGQSRRLPAYAAVGKPFVPVPVFRWCAGQRLDQCLFDLQRGFVESVVDRAPAGIQLVIASGDVLLGEGLGLPEIPDADIVLLGMQARPEDACRFGVLFCEREDASRLRFFLQKPSPDEIRQQSGDTRFFVDCGLWLLRERAVKVLMEACGWSPADPTVAPFDLYGVWGPCLGTQPVREDAAVGDLRVAVAVVPGGTFHHFGRTEDVIDAVYELQNPPPALDRQMREESRAPHPRQFVQNASFRLPLGYDRQACIWVENAVIPDTWQLADHHMITNIPDNDWSLCLPAGICLDMPPVRGGGRVLRVYGMDDPFRGKPCDEGTCWLGRRALDWFQLRGLEIPDDDMQDVPLFPVVADLGDVVPLLDWMLGGDPEGEGRDLWLSAPRLSAADLLEQVDVAALLAERALRLAGILPVLARRHADNMFFQLDLAHFGRAWQAAGLAYEALPEMPEELPVLRRMHGHMLRARVAVLQGMEKASAAEEADAFGVLREAVLAPVRARQVHPVRQLLDDQIVWGRSPARLDLAGGWTDTPPYCLENGGAVLNMAVNLNGQPPVQVFGRLLSEPKLVIRSIDLGLSEELHTYADVENFRALGSAFGIARAAFALAGFAPDFHEGQHSSLRSQLEAFGGGIEVSMLAAIPKGSGLGTSSILAATLLGVLSDLAGLGWERPEISRRTLALEQMLTSGGGWQDQIGGIYGGVKLIETRPGLEQEPILRWAPSTFFDQSGMQSCLMLYYTGITRVARSILGEIVRGLFLNSRAQLDVMHKIGTHARAMYELILQNDMRGFGEGLAYSWALNQELDSGTNVPEIAAMIAMCGDGLSGCKLAGAGGGGFLLMQATDADAAQWIREKLSKSPPNARARFVNLAVSSEGLQITRS